MSKTQFPGPGEGCSSVTRRVEVPRCSLNVPHRAGEVRMVRSGARARRATSEGTPVTLANAGEDSRC